MVFRKNKIFDNFFENVFVFFRFGDLLSNLIIIIVCWLKYLRNNPFRLETGLSTDRMYIDETRTLFNCGWSLTLK